MFKGRNLKKAYRAKIPLRRNSFGCEGRAPRGQRKLSFYVSELGMLCGSTLLTIMSASKDAFAGVIFFPLLLAIVGSVSAQDLSRGLQNYSDIIHKKKTIHQLSPQEFQEVLLVFRRLVNEGSARRSKQRLSYESHEIEVAHKDKIFIINGEKYEARTSCFDFEKGDKVVFLEGRPLGMCVSTELLNLRNDRVCRIWCQLDSGLMESKN